MNGSQNARLGSHLGNEPGWIGLIGEDSFSHRFGGQRWSVECTHAGGENCPALLLTLDLYDQRLEKLRFPSNNRVSEIPLCSHVNSAELTTQVYEIDGSAKRVSFVTDSPPPADQSMPLQIPLSERRLMLVPMGRIHLPIDEASYWQACDSFVGGSSFIRVLGPPVWLQGPDKPECACGQDMDYVASIGYEKFDSPAGFLDSKAFFIGEVALYFFFCQRCARVHVITQNT